MTHRSKRYVMPSMRLRYLTHTLSLSPFILFIFKKQRKKRDTAPDCHTSLASVGLVVFVQQTHKGGEREK